MNFLLNPRSLTAFLHDLVMAALTFVTALYLRVGDKLPTQFEDGLSPRLGLFVAVSGMAFLGLGLYRGVWRYASMNDAVQIARASALAVLLYGLCDFLLFRMEDLPRSALVISWLVMMLYLGGPRLLYRVWKDRGVDFVLRREKGPVVRVLLVGADDEAEAFIRESTRSRENPFYVLAMLGVGTGRIGRRIRGIEVMGAMEDAAEVLARLKRSGEGVDRLVLTNRALAQDAADTLLKVAEEHGATLARLPKITDLKSGLADPLQIKPIAIEDLLGRAPAELDRSKLERFVAGKRVLITGAGGSIGSELVHQVARLGPTEMVLVDSSEYNLYRIDLELGGAAPDLVRVPILGDVRDKTRITQLFDRYKPQIVFHAAALKHVPLMEQNPNEAVLTNLVGTRQVADAARAAEVETFVLISTDKAVNPTNVMGATKRLAEIYAQALDAQGGTRFCTVRFGNVLGSTGSVVPLFRRQLEAGGPITVTHPDITRYFMTIPEAVELVLQAGQLGTEGTVERGKIFVLDMGKPIKIIDLARQMIQLAGYQPERDIPIKITGLRPGEKLYEELFHEGEPPQKTERDGILLASPRRMDLVEITALLDGVERAARARDTGQTLGLIARMIPEFDHKPGI